MYKYTFICIVWFLVSKLYILCKLSYYWSKYHLQYFTLIYNIYPFKSFIMSTSWEKWGKGR